MTTETPRRVSSDWLTNRLCYVLAALRCDIPPALHPIFFDAVEVVFAKVEGYQRVG